MTSISTIPTFPLTPRSKIPAMLYASSLALLLSVAATFVSAVAISSDGQIMGRVCVLDMARDMTKGFVRQYVIQSGDYEGLYTMTHNEDEALHVLYNTWEAGSLQALDNSDSLHLYLAFIAGPGDANNGNLVEGAYSFVYLGGSNERNAANSPPQLNYNTLPEGDKKVSETGTWAVDVPKQEGRFAFIELYPEWTNLDGKRPSEQIVFYDERNGFFGITKNLEEQKKFSEGTVQVTFRLC